MDGRATDDNDWLAKTVRRQPRAPAAVALRMLGSPGEADAAVQEAWLKVSRSDTAASRTSAAG